MGNRRLQLTRLLDHLPDNPFRPLDWRWRLASDVLQYQLPARWWHHDTWVGAVCSYLKRRQALRRRLLAPLAAIDHAHGIWSSTNPQQRLELEIRLLSGQSYNDVASNCGVDATVVEAYERVFYHVADSRDAIDYMAMILDPGMSTLVGTPERETVARILAYRLGTAVVEHLLAYLGLRPSGDLHCGVDRALRRLITVLSVPADERTSPCWLRLNAILSRFKNEARANSAAPVLMPLLITSELPADLLDHSVSACSASEKVGPTTESIVVQLPAPLFGPPILSAVG
jgi:hypothetical protein